MILNVCIKCTLNVLCVKPWEKLHLSKPNTCQAFPSIVSSQHSLVVSVRIANVILYQAIFYVLVSYDFLFDKYTLK